jgi:hypothetical protein
MASAFLTQNTNTKKKSKFHDDTNHKKTMALNMSGRISGSTSRKSTKNSSLLST